MADRLTGLLGLAKKAGRLRSGEFSTEQSVKSGKAKLCIVASDASDNTKKKFEDMCKYCSVPFQVTALSKQELGHAAGCADRTSAAVEEAGFAQSMIKLIEGGRAHG